MPNRIIKESAFTSDRIAALSDFEFRLWVGLITQADDAGRGDARPAIIKGRVFALRERTTTSDIDRALHALAAHGCVSLYVVDGKPYYEFPSWADHQRVREIKSKYPPRGELPQVAANCGELRPESNPIQSNPNPNPNPNPIDAQTRAFPSEEMQKAFDEWLSYKRERREAYKATGLQALISRLNNEITTHGESAVIEAIRYSMAQGWKGIYYSKDAPKPTQSKASYDLDAATEKMNTKVPELKKKRRN